MVLFIKDNITEVGLKCTKTVEFIKSLPYDRLDDVRFLVIKPEGYIAEHSDVPEHNWLDTLICQFHILMEVSSF